MVAWKLSSMNKIYVHPESSQVTHDGHWDGSDLLQVPDNITIVLFCFSLLFFFSAIQLRVGLYVLRFSERSWTNGCAVISRRFVAWGFHHTSEPAQCQSVIFRIVFMGLIQREHCNTPKGSYWKTTVQIPLVRPPFLLSSHAPTEKFPPPGPFASTLIKYFVAAILIKIYRHGMNHKKSKQS